MKRLATILPLLIAISPYVLCQVLTPAEVSDLSASRLQQVHFKTLMQIGTEIESHKFPYPFHLSRVLDIDLSKLAEVDQRSLRFDFYPQ